jgi:hypothetical protein
MGEGKFKSLGIGHWALPHSQIATLKRLETFLSTASTILSGQEAPEVTRICTGLCAGNQLLITDSSRVRQLA